MSKRLFSFPMDAQEEANGIKIILDEHHIEFYESPGSRWGFSNAAVWIKNSQDFPKAQQLFQQYQQEYAQKARQDYQHATGYNPHAPLLERIKFAATRLLHNKPLFLLLIIAIALLAIYLRTFFTIFSA